MYLGDTLPLFPAIHLTGARGEYSPWTYIALQIVGIPWDCFDIVITTVLKNVPLQDAVNYLFGDSSKIQNGCRETEVVSTEQLDIAFNVQLRRLSLKLYILYILSTNPRDN